MKKLTLGELRKMTEGLPDDIIIGYSHTHRGGSDNWGRTTSDWTVFRESHSCDVSLNLGKKELSIVNV